MGMIGFLHTAPVHVATFDELVQAASPTTRAHHVVDEALLARARDAGPDAVAADVAAQLARLATAGADVVVCTCSTVGDVAERVATDACPGLPTFRVDRPMARLAVADGRRIGVVAALESTLAPTRALLEDEAGATGVDPAVETVLAAAAWERFEAGDHAGYLSAITEAAREIAGRVDVVVLAQASMAGAVERLADLAVPVLSSPAIAVEHARHLLRD